MYKKTRRLQSLSEQQLLDCSGSFGNKGCYGGVPSNAFRYVYNKGGICSESSYPYLGYVSHNSAYISTLEILVCSRSTTVQTAIAQRLQQLDLEQLISRVAVKIASWMQLTM